MSTSLDSQSMDSTFGKGFDERNRALMQILEPLAALHPAVGILFISFKVFVSLELKRRTSDPEVIALLLKVQDTMTVFVQVFTLVPPDQSATAASAALVERVSGIIADMPREIRDCANVCDSYYSLSSVKRYLKQNAIHQKLKTMGQHFEERRRNLEMLLLQAASANLAKDSTPPSTNASSGTDTASSTTVNSGLAAIESLFGKQDQSAVLEDLGAHPDGAAPVNALLYYHEQRAAVLAQGLSVSDLQDALRSCEQCICASLLSILGSRDAKHAVMLLEGARAQAFLDAVQDVLDRGSLPSAEHTSQARRLIIRLSEARDQLPSSLFITGVTNHDEHPTFSGGFGDIYRASFHGGRVSLKRIRMFHAGADSPRSRLQFCREALVWQTLRHEYVLPLIGIDRETFPSSFCMVSPWMKHGTILKYLNEHGRADVDKMLLQIAEGLAYLHSMKIVHGDLRGTNILVSDDWKACLADFGLTGVIEDAVSTTSGALTSTANHAGSLRWFAPELMAPTFFGCERFVRTPATDVYAFACVCLELYTGSPPFSDVSPDVAAMLKVVAGERPAQPATMSDNLWQLVTAAWAQIFLDRPGLEAIIESMRMLLKPKDVD